MVMHHALTWFNIGESEGDRERERNNRTRNQNGSVRNGGEIVECRTSKIEQKTSRSRHTTDMCTFLSIFKTWAVFLTSLRTLVRIELSYTSWEFLSLSLLLLSPLSLTLFRPLSMYLYLFNPPPPTPYLACSFPPTTFSLFSSSTAFLTFYTPHAFSLSSAISNQHKKATRNSVQMCDTLT